MKKRRFSLPIHPLSATRITGSSLLYRRLARVMLSLTVAFHVTGCSPGYVVRAAYEQSKILLARRPLDEVIADPKTSADERLKLEFVREARAFGADIGLRPKGSFTAYADIGKDTLAWIVVASRRDSFDLYTWWFPIVGTVPYKGFFNLEDAQKQATYLEQNGYESSVRGTEAFSTLGWFNDPLLSTTLKNPAFRIVNTVLHESVHSTIWIKDNVPFNETLASFVGGQATIEFFSRRLATISKDTTLRPELESSLRAAEQDQQFQSEFAAVLSKLYQGLTALYSDSNLSSAQKIEKRVAVFETHIGPFRRKHPRMSALKTINNAEILQFTIYMTKLELFEALFAKSGRSWSTFFSHIAAVKQAVEQDSSKDPWKALERIVHSEVL